MRARTARARAFRRYLERERVRRPHAKATPSLYRYRDRVHHRYWMAREHPRPRGCRWTAEEVAEIRERAARLAEELRELAE